MSFDKGVVMRMLAFALLVLPSISMAADLEMGLTLKDHRFVPAELKVPAGKKVKLLVNNTDATPEEFESHQLNREKLIAGHARATIYVGPLSPGRYTFWGEFNEKTAQGVIVAE
jgi:plastocyanin